MKIRILSIACVTTAAALLAACTAVYKNSDACEQMMRSKLAETSTDTLKIAHTGAGIDGSRVVVEGSIEHVMTASEVAAATPASAPHAASGARSASGASAVSVGAVGASGASAASEAMFASGVTAVSEAMAASEASAASTASTPSLKPAKPKKTVTPAAAECTFHGPTLNVFNWLAPDKFVAHPDDETD